MTKQKLTPEEAHDRKIERQRKYRKQTNYAANNKYQKEKTKSYTIRFIMSTDADIIEYLDKQENKAGFFKRLIREAIAKENN